MPGTNRPKSLAQIDPRYPKIQLLIHIKEKTKVVNLDFEFKNAESEIEYFTKYPYNLLAFKDNKKALMVARPTNLLDSNLVIDNIKTEDLDYEVLYIGQAYGKDGKRTALDRLSSHETVQRIYTHSLSQHPDSDIWIMLTNFSQQSMLMMAGNDLIKVKEEDLKIEDEKLEHFSDNRNLSISEKQKINFTEAALIKYFEPQYNKDFKNVFPSSNHKSYSECYSLDVRAMTIELDTSEMIRNIYTNKSGRKDYHMKMFEFNSDKDRISLLEAFE
ncbi:hypothetical protein [Salegentibacter salegens]|uniref:Uncharacterized protein n=1 Tax=Salegentibacter salegens TaxID=143223 RepID=A0A1M7JAM6_9FLAO|nr:hypothetical protein [Salegentibacter salegens]PRX39294.1 hypothetical protein LY58_03365 [Salegentibacter salegens]SHM50056.1 hypothetical protein SAMN05878281_0885 [Salegentibacter salegens]